MRLRKPEGRYIVDEGGCWIWQLYREPSGYGKVTHEGKPGQWAHRVEWERVNGPVPDGLQLDHVVCNNGKGGCINPAHMEPVTSAENARRAGKLTWAAVADIRTTTDSNVRAAMRHGVDSSVISRVRSRKAWWPEPTGASVRVKTFEALAA